MNKKNILGILRISLGWIFLWAFLDKTFGLGFATEKSSAWIAGVSPTAGFLQFGTQGPFAEIFQSLSGMVWVDWIFMLTLLFVGVTVITGFYLRWGAYVGVGLMTLMYLAGFIWPEHNPVVDDHVIYALVLIYLANQDSGYRIFKK